ncbi:hypothetical protein [Clostridium sp.]|uniref:hypothetical protein n=1 Tax=Clostridium sp. TaxID=1506 RepID=UPI003216B6D0
MIIEASVRDLKVKGRKFRNEGRSIGIIVRNNGERLPISVKRSDIETFLKRFGDRSTVTLNVDGNSIDTSIVSIDKDVIFHYPHNIEFKEV